MFFIRPIFRICQRGGRVVHPVHKTKILVGFKPFLQFRSICLSVVKVKSLPDDPGRADPGSGRAIDSRHHGDLRLWACSFHSVAGSCYHVVARPIMVG